MDSATTDSAATDGTTTDATQEGGPPKHRRRWLFVVVPVVLLLLFEWETGGWRLPQRGLPALHAVRLLASAAVVAENGRAVWRHVERARLFVRPLSAAFIETYLDQEWPAIAGCVGCFRIEGRGVQLFKRIEGDHFTVLGMPLFPVLDYLRTRGELAS